MNAIIAVCFLLFTNVGIIWIVVSPCGLVLSFVLIIHHFIFAWIAVFLTDSWVVYYKRWSSSGSKAVCFETAWKCSYCKSFLMCKKKKKRQWQSKMGRIRKCENVSDMEMCTCMCVSSCVCLRRWVYVLMLLWCDGSLQCVYPVYFVLLSIFLVLCWLPLDWQLSKKNSFQY